MSEMEPLSIQDAAEIMRADIPEILSDIETAPPDIVDAIQSPAPAAMLHSLQQGGVESIQIDPQDMTTPVERVGAILSQGYDTLQSHNIPSPDLGQYYAAQAHMAETGADLDQAVSHVQSSSPLSLPMEILADPHVHTLELRDADNLTPPLVLAEAPAAMDVDEARTLTDAEIVAEQLDGTNYCELSVEDQFQNFIRWQGVERDASDNFIAETISERPWSELPEEIRTYEPDLPNLFGFRNPYSGWVDDLGDHAENQRFPGGYHIAGEEGHIGVELHFDAYDPLNGPIENMGHYLYEVRPLNNGELTVEHQDNHPNWEVYEEYCDNSL